MSSLNRAMKVTEEQAGEAAIMLYEICEQAFEDGEFHELRLGPRACQEMIKLYRKMKENNY